MNWALHGIRSTQSTSIYIHTYIHTCFIYLESYTVNKYINYFQITTITSLVGGGAYTWRGLFMLSYPGSLVWRFSLQHQDFYSYGGCRNVISIPNRDRFRIWMREEGAVGISPPIYSSGGFKKWNVELVPVSSSPPLYPWISLSEALRDPHQFAWLLVNYGKEVALSGRSKAIVIFTPFPKL